MAADKDNRILGTALEETVQLGHARGDWRAVVMHWQDPRGIEDVDHRIEVFQAQGQMLSDECEQDVTAPGKRCQFIGTDAVAELAHVQNP